MMRGATLGTRLFYRSFFAPADSSLGRRSVANSSEISRTPIPLEAGSRRLLGGKHERLSNLVEMFGDHLQSQPSNKGTARIRPIKDRRISRSNFTFFTRG